MKQLAVICALATVTGLYAQQPNSPPDTPSERSMRGGPNAEHPRMGMGMMPGGPADRWLGYLREKDPKEFERLMALRDQDPPAFHTQMRERLQREVMSRIERERPRLFQALESLPPEDHEWLMKRLGGQVEGPRGRGEDAPRGLEDAELKSALGEKVREYQQAKDPAARAALKAEIRAELKGTIEKRQQRRRAELDQMEQRINEMRKQLDQGGTTLEKLIDAKLEELTRQSK